MRALLSAALWLTAGLSAPALLPAEDQQAVLSIYANLGPGEARKGTGFVISPSGEVLTAYHVITGARHLRLFTLERQQIDDATVEVVYPDDDLALLRSSSLAGRPHLELVSSPVSEAGSSRRREVKVIGHPYGIPYQHYFGALSASSVYRSSREFWSKGRQIFRRDVPIIPLDVTADRGLSGAPVILEERVIGVLSGTYHRGRGITWAIPVELLRSSAGVRYGRRADSIRDWPASGLMASTWVGLQEYLGEDFEAARSLALLEGAAEDLGRVYSKGVGLAGGALPHADTAFQTLSRGIGAPGYHSPADLDRHLEPVYALHGSLRELANLIGDFQRSSTRIEEGRLGLRERVVGRMGELSDGPERELVRRRLLDVSGSAELAAPIFRQFLADSVAGLEQMSEGLGHRSHLDRIRQRYRGRSESAARAAYDEEIREILKQLQISVTLIRSALRAVASEEFSRDSAVQLRKLYGVMQVSELVIYAAAG